MTALQLAMAWWIAHNGKPYWRPGDPETRFGEWGFDCSGGTKRATQAAGITVLPTSTGDIAKWALATGRASACRNARRAKPGDFMLYDRYGKPVDSNGPRGHVEQVAPDGQNTWGSAGTGGVRLRDRGDFWTWAVDMSDFFAPAVPAPEPPKRRPHMLLKRVKYKDSTPGPTYQINDSGKKRHLVNADQIAVQQGLMRNMGLDDTITTFTPEQANAIDDQ